MAQQVIVRDPGAVRSFASQLRRTAQELEQAGSSLRGASSGVKAAWSDPQQEKVQQQCEALAAGLARFREEAEQVSRYCEQLAAKVEAIR